MHALYRLLRRLYHIPVLADVLPELAGVPWMLGSLQRQGVELAPVCLSERQLQVSPLRQLLHVLAEQRAEEVASNLTQ